ncbi:hypothetical protein GH714_005959 [Hevea brasiliensis]|uniref:PGG domain-containing protein n=1 Tax=Hevea brasiliensis TaxID=3981 RepID=A0A6A6N2K4_HEVBR|nr:hypothetical protein GH714_005959 [Hevea brasiliensis]
MMATNIVSELLDGLNYANWSVCMRSYLLANDLWDIVEATNEAPSPEEAEAEFKAWIKKNAAALHAIQISCKSDILSQIKEIGSARICWDTLAEMHEVQSPGDQIQPQEAESPPMEEELQQEAAVNQGTEGHVYVQFRPLCKAIERGIQVKLPTAQYSDVRINISQNGHKHPRSLLVRGLGPLRRLCSNLLQFFGLKQIYDTKLTHAYALEILHWMSEDISTIDDTKLEQSGVYDAFFRAIKYGVIEVVMGILKANPDILTVLNKNGRGILDSAVEHRQEKIFSLIYVLGTRKYMLISGTDQCQNNILHIAAKLATPDRLAHISGAVLQMQRELQWFKEVESIVNPLSQEYTNSSNEKPSQIFSDTHKQLVSDGEQWMKETATSCTVVGALIITIMFTAAFTVPGVLMFLGVLTSRYAEDDFLKSLPTKLIIGLSTLFISIAAMMAYVKKVLKHFNMSNAKPVTISFATHFMLSVDISPKIDEKMEHTSSVPYLSVVGSIMYAMVCTQPDISHVVSVVSRYMACLGKEHWQTVKWILRYLKGTTDIGLTFNRAKMYYRYWFDISQGQDE